MSGRPDPWGHSGIKPSACSADTRTDSSDHYEMGGFLLFGGLILVPAIIVLGLVEAYVIVSLWFGLPSFPAQ